MLNRKRLGGQLEEAKADLLKAGIDENAQDPQERSDNLLDFYKNFR